MIPARHAASTIGDCLQALSAQSLPRSDYEVLVVVEAAGDEPTAEAARAGGATVHRVSNASRRRGAGAARNVGIRAAKGRWVAFTDADCVPSRGWLKALLDRVEADRAGDSRMLGACGLTIGYQSLAPAARFVDLSGGLRADRHLAHARYPWAPTSNALYRREALLAVGGFDRRFVSYEGADLHTRLLREVGGAFEYVPRAVVHHRHRSTWREYWKQQVSYGRGYAQFFRRYADELRWDPRAEARAWLDLAADAVRSTARQHGDDGLLRRGYLVKKLAQRVGFLSTYWNPHETARWRAPSAGGEGSQTPERAYSRLAPWWSPWGIALRLAATFRSPGDVYWSLRIGWFIINVSAALDRAHLSRFMDELARAPRPPAGTTRASVERVARLRHPWLRLPGLRSRDTCYVRALVLYRFVDPGRYDLRLRVGAEWHDRPGGVLRGHAWVTCDDEVLEPPLRLDDHETLQMIQLG